MQNSPPQRKIAFFGFRPPLADVLTMALQTAYTIHPITTEQLTGTALPPDVMVLCHSDAFSDHALVSPSMLRKRYFIWNPIIVIDRFPSPMHDDEQWEIPHLAPPLDANRLKTFISQACPFSQGRQQEVIAAALYELRDDLLYLHQLGRGNQRVGDDKVRREITEVVGLMRSIRTSAGIESFARLIQSVESALTLPTFSEDVLHAVLPSIVDADTAARETQQPAHLRSKLHQLSNTVRLALSQHLTQSPAKLSDLKQILSHIPIQQVEAYFPGLGVPLTSLREQVCTPVSGQSTAIVDAASHGEVLIRCAALIAQALHPLHPVSSSPIQRIVLIEDDPGWRSQIQATLSTIEMSQPIQTAGTIEDGERLLQHNEGGTLALVDLGLPRNAKDASKGLIDLEGGLKLLKTCMANPSSGIRPIVLTAAENIADTVREALASGVDAADYIQKDPRTWEEQLRSRVQLALRTTPPVTLPVVDVFRCTGRLIRIDGVEVALERKPYALFEYLAAHARTQKKVAAIRTALTVPGERDITPAMSKQQQERFLHGEDISPFDLLTPKHIQDYLYDLRQQIARGLEGLSIAREYSTLITYHPDEDAYCLNADVRLIDRFDALANSAVLRKVLVVEDHPQWQASLMGHLRGLGFEVRGVQTLDDAQAAIDEWAPHYVTLDMQIPRNGDDLTMGVAHEENGIAVMRYLKERLPDVGVIVLTSIAWKDAVMLELLRSGVAPHDYIAKQWDDALGRVAQSLWRLAIRRERGSKINPEMSPDTVTHIHIDSASDTVEIAGYPVKPYPDGRKVLLLLAQSPNMPVQRDAIIDMLWPDPDTLPDEYEAQLNTIMSRLRKAISDGTQGEVDGKQLIRNADGVYWLQGIVSYRS